MSVGDIIILVILLAVCLRAAVVIYRDRQKNVCSGCSFSGSCSLSSGKNRSVRPGNGCKKEMETAE